MNDPAKQPVVQAVPSFKVGDTAVQKDTKEEFQVIGITPDKKLVLRGVAGHLEPSGYEKKGA